MILGTVDAQLNLLVPLILRGFNGQEETITSILDTGFTRLSLAYDGTNCVFRAIA
jgi:hypothetical protein